jgi:hypothetical protein
MSIVNQLTINPHTNLAKVVTTLGKENAHHLGKRASTVRELAAFQGFLLDLHCRQYYRSEKTVRLQQCCFAYVGRLPTTPACWTRKRKCWLGTTSSPRRNTCQYCSTSRQICLPSPIGPISPARSNLILHCLSGREARHLVHADTRPCTEALLPRTGCTKASPLLPQGVPRSCIPARASSAHANVAATP